MYKLSKREIRLLKVLSALVGSLVIYFFLFLPVIEFKKRSEDFNRSSLERLVRFDEVILQYRETKNEKDKLEAAISSGTGISVLVDEIAASLNISGNKVYLRERPGRLQDGVQIVTAEVKFEGLHIALLLDFINRLEKSNTLLKIRSLTITSGLRDTNRYDAVITINGFYRRS